MFYLVMSSKGFEETQGKTQISVSTPKEASVDDKPLKFGEKQNKKDNQQRKVDINVLKARVQDIQNKENKKNITILISFLIAIATLVFYLSA